MCGSYYVANASLVGVYPSLQVDITRMVLGTGWVLGRWLHKIMCGAGEEEEERSHKDKLEENLEIYTGEYSILSAVGDGNIQNVQHCHSCEECDVTKIQNEILSVTAVLKIKTGQARELRKKLEKKMRLMEDMGTQTEEVKEEHVSYDYATDR